MRLLSLFSGCGGMDLGFEGGFTCLKKSINETLHPDWIDEDLGDKVKLKQTGFETVFANDIRLDAKTAWVNYFKKSNPNAEEIYHLDSIINIVNNAKSNKSVFPSDIDIVTGGFPCQDFSLAGKRLGFHSDKSDTGKKLKIDEPSIQNRGNLYMWMREVISIVKPKMFVAENVKGLTTLKDAKEIIENDFAGAASGGYLIVKAKVIQAADYGVPQSRERIIFFGFKKSELNPKALKELSLENISEEYNPYPSKTHSLNSSENLNPYVTCYDALHDLSEPEDSTDLSQREYSKAKFLNHGQGNTEIKLNSISPTIRSEHHGNIEYRRLSLEHGGKNLQELNLGLKERRLTVRECARLQTFPDDYSFIIKKNNGVSPLSASNAYKIIGNALPCILAYNIAMNLISKWKLYFK